MEIEKINQKLLDNMRRSEFSGYDIFDGLNSRLLKSIKLYRFPFVRLAWIQFFKRFPINLRDLVGIPKKRNPKGIGLIILGLLEDYKRTKDRVFLDEAVSLGEWLLKKQCEPVQWKHSCWGYHFPWQAKAFYVPIGKPNIITTCYVARALSALHGQGGGIQFQHAAIEASRFIIKHLYIEHGNRCFFSYIPGETAFIHNASLWGAAVVAKTSTLINDQKMAEMAHSVCMQSVQEQLPNGAWLYGGNSHHHFIDGFHTGYNLEALDLARKSLSTHDFDDAIEKGLNYYRRKFFLNNGMPKYYHNSIYPVDMHLISQAVLTFLTVSGTKEDRALVDKILSWSVKNMYIESTGYFRYQIYRWYNNNICYIRWTQAWAYYSLAVYLNKNNCKSVCELE